MHWVAIRFKTRFKGILCIFDLDCGDETTPDTADAQISPPVLAGKMVKWLNEYGVSQSVFAKQYMERSQGTVSEGVTIGDGKSTVAEDE